MLLHIPNVLDADALSGLRARIDAAGWIDGNATSGFQAAMAKKNRQLPQRDDAAIEGGRVIRKALEANLLFLSAALPQVVLPPLFNRYGAGEAFEDHVDNAIRSNPEGGAIRADLSATLFLTPPEDYDGGELMIEDTFGLHQIKLPAGDMVLYPASSLHHVTPVTRGERVSSFFWIQSYVRSAEQRALLFDMDRAIQALGLKAGQTDRSIISLTGAYHNLLRMWAGA